MAKFRSANTAIEEYASKYPHIAMTRENGVLEVTFHNGDGETALFFDAAGDPSPHAELTEAFYDIARDPGNRVVILTGAGGSFFGHADFGDAPETMRAEGFIGTDTEVVRMVMNQLNIPVPMIAAVDGPCFFFSHIVLLCDIALGSPTAAFRDGTHFRAGLVPGDGAHVLWPMVLGPGRGRYFLLTDQTIEAAEALQLGVLQEVVAADDLLDRARELARDIADKPPLTVRATRMVLTEHIKRRLVADLPIGVTAELFAGTAHWPSGIHPPHPPVVAPSPKAQPLRAT